MRGFGLSWSETESLTLEEWRTLHKLLREAQRTTEINRRLG